MGLRDVFPDAASLAVCLAYMGTFILQGILTRASQSEGGYKYNTTTAVLVAEVLKLIASFCIYMQGHTLGQFRLAFSNNSWLLGLYFVPAALYCVYNNLAFVNLANYDPTTYYLLLQFRVVVTGVTFQFMFRKKLSQMQWLSLAVLTLGCIIKEYHWSQGMDAIAKDHHDISYTYTMLVLVQVLCSCFAGVYNERLLKSEGHDVHIMVQNTFMYLDSILANILFLCFNQSLFEALSPSNLQAMMAPSVMVVCLNNAMIGIITSLFLQRLNSVVKVFASAVELIATAYLSWLIFGIPVDGYTFIALILIVAASSIYSMSPIKAPAASTLPT